MQPLMNSVLKKINSEHDIRVAYNSSGSSGGETGIKDNTLVFGFTSRALKTEFTKVPCAGLKFAIDGILIIANLPSDCILAPSNLDIVNGKVDILQQIYEGATKQWGDLLGCQSSKKVIPINREHNSGTRDVFQGKLQIKEFSSSLRTVNNTAAAIQEVKNIQGAIGYVSYGAKKLVDEANLSILRYKGIVALPATLETDYDLKRYFELTFRLKDNKNLSLVKDFLTFLKDKEKGQQAIQADELIPVWEWYGTNPFSDLSTLD
ncbi:PstS family phosphate ABC transporter substrate-binding protein [Spiroplasma endosymbiont of Glossina fuscipes fuscipes]|uniref:PstS family phosphate ABC transporter substrate-binding protein n=1 Tax=Spiroplasma endosymbiont of Glossina fuscipes fuscipes TaxID=2004463 RepID=UPI003C75C37F